MKSSSLNWLADAAFALLVITMVVVVWQLIRAGAGPARRPRALRRFALVAIGWLAFTALLSVAGVLRQWTAVPPRLLLVLVPPVVAMVLLSRSRRVGQWLDQLPPVWLIAPQAFRIAVEVLLWALYEAGRLPVQMTFEGRNWDILVGLTAPVVAWLVGRRGRAAKPLVLAWNVAGLAILFNIVVVAITSAPLPFRLFFNEPANTIIAEWPFVWLPAVLVPIAYTLHALSLRQWLRPVPAILTVNQGQSAPGI